MDKDTVARQCKAEIERPTIARAPTLEDFCDAANDLYAAPTEERFLAVVNLARESLILRGQAWDEGFAFGTSGQRDELYRLRQQLAATRLALVQYGAHDGACAVCDIDDEGRHCACDCGYDAAIKAAEDKTHNVEFSGGAPLYGAASAGTQGYASGGEE